MVGEIAIITVINQYIVVIWYRYLISVIVGLIDSIKIFSRSKYCLQFGQLFFASFETLYLQLFYIGKYFYYFKLYVPIFKKIWFIRLKRTGYKGRIGVFELLILDESVREAIIQIKTSQEISAFNQRALWPCLKNASLKPHREWQLLTKFCAAFPCSRNPSLCMNCEDI